MDSKFKIDAIDTTILQLLTSGKNGQEISSTVKVPRSTIQRRLKNLMSNGLVIRSFTISYEQMGFNLGLVNIIVKKGDIDEIAKKVYDLDGIISVEVHIGNSDIVGHIVYKNGQDLRNIVSSIKQIDGVKSAIWSERIYQIPYKQQLKLDGNDINERPILETN